MTIKGKDGQTLFGYGTDPFDSPNIPEPIASIFISNDAAFQTVTGRRPANSFALTLDFSTPALIDDSSPVSSPTPNFSQLTIEGDRDSWVASIQEAVVGVLGRKSNRRGFIHAPFVYDIGLVLIGLPAALYTCWRLAGIVENNLGVYSPFFSVTAYIYVVILTLYIYRILFGYTRWSFPTVELTDGESQAKTHRRFWIAIVIGLVVSAVYDLVV